MTTLKLRLERMSTAPSPSAENVTMKLLWSSVAIRLLRKASSS
jgi:hypothetical protein